MADVITRFKLETTQYDSKLRDAAKELQSFSKQAVDAGKGFGGFSQKAVEAARALGTTASGATNAKDKVRDLVGSFNDAAKAYNKLSDAQRQSDFGRAMAASLEQLQQRIREAKQELYGLTDAVEKAGKGGGLFGGGKLDGMLQVFGGNLMTKGAGMLAGLASEMGDMIQQGVELARQGEGIRIAFERLGRGDILDGLREATHGTVTDIELMKAAVKFNDFKLPLDELGTMLAFAQQKAKDTGQSVDYMVDSIVTGLGRKSLMILDNLGLSAAEIKEKMAETGDMTKAVGAIIREQMEEAGDYVETAADRAAQANVDLQNKMEELGRKFAPLQEASNNLWTSMKIGIMDVVGGPLTNFINKLTEAGRLASQYGVLGGNAKVGRMTANLAGASEANRNGIYQQQRANFWRYINQREQQLKDIQAWQRGERGEALQSRIGAIRDKYGYLDSTKIRAEVDAAKKMLAEYEQAAKGILSPKQTGLDETVQTVDTLKKKLSELQSDYRAAIKAGDSGKAGDLLKQINQTKRDIKGLDPTALTTSHTTTPAQQAAENIKAAEQEYSRALEKAALEVDNGRATTADAKKAEYNATMALWTAYSKAADTVPSNEGYRQRMTELEASIKTLGGEVTQSAEAQKAAEQAARELAQKQKNLAQATAAAATAQQGNDLKAFYQAQAKAVQNGGTAQQAVGFTATTANIDAFIGNLKQRISESEVGTDLYNSLTAQLADTSAMSNLLQVAIKNGIDPAQMGLNPQEFWSKVFGDNPGDYIKDKTWQGIVEKMNAYLKDKGIQIGLDVNTGSVSSKTKQNPYLSKNEDGKMEATLTNVLGGIAGGINNMVSGMEQMGIEIPEGLKQGLSAIQGVTSILSGIATTVLAIEAIAGADALIPFARGGIVHAANGFVPGNRYSADDIPVAVSSGELILNRAQQGNLAAQLEGGGMRRLDLVATIKGEDIRLALNNNSRRRGRGEYVTADFR